MHYMRLSFNKNEMNVFKSKQKNCYIFDRILQVLVTFY